jgi:hypothetical protein
MSPEALLTGTGDHLRVVSVPAGLFLVALVLMPSGIRSQGAVARRFRVTLRHVIRMHLQLRHTDSRQSRLQTVLPWRNSMARARNGGSHDGLYAARMYRHDRRWLLRRLRQSSGRTRLRSSRGSGFSGVTRPCRRAGSNGIPSGVGIFLEAEKRGPHDGMYAARVYRHHRRWLLRRLRQSSGRTPVCARGSGFSGVTRLGRRAGSNGCPPGGCGGGYRR